MRSGPVLRYLRHIPGQPLTYVQNPKAACTAIEAGLWRVHSPATVPLNPHRRSAEHPFIQDYRQASDADLDSLFRSQFFSAVRNPYGRFLSAYLDKVRRPRIWAVIRAPMGVALDSTVSITELLACLSELDPKVVDKHLQPQSLLLSPRRAPLDWLGHLEDRKGLAAFLSRFGIALTHRRPNATNASARIRELIGPREADAILAYYRADFERFGYADDPAILHPIRPASALSADRAPLRRLLFKSLEPPDQVHEREAQQVES